MKNAQSSPNIRLNVHVHAVLKQLAEEEHESMQSVLERAIEQYRRDKFLRDASADYAVLRGNAKEWKKEMEERSLLDGTLSDGLDE